MVPEPISSSLSAALAPVESMMSTNNSANPQVASLQSPTFASVLSYSLLPFEIPSLQEPTEPPNSAGLPLHLQAGTKDGGILSTDRTEPIVSLSPMETGGAIFSAMKPVPQKQTDARSPRNTTAHLFPPVPYSIPAGQSPLLTVSGDSRVLYSAAGVALIPPQVASAPPSQTQRPQTLTESVGTRISGADRTGSDPSLAQRPALAESTEPASNPSGTSSTAKASAENLLQPNHVSSAKPITVPALSNGRFASRYDLSDLHPPELMETVSAHTRNIQAAAMPNNAPLQSLNPSAPLASLAPDENHEPLAQPAPSAVSTLVPNSNETHPSVIAQSEIAPFVTVQFATAQTGIDQPELVQLTTAQEVAGLSATEQSVATQSTAPQSSPAQGVVSQSVVARVKINGPLGSGTGEFEIAPVIPLKMAASVPRIVDAPAHVAESLSQTPTAFVPAAAVAAESVPSSKLPHELPRTQPVDPLASSMVSEPSSGGQKSVEIRPEPPMDAAPERAPATAPAQSLATATVAAPDQLSAAPQVEKAADLQSLASLLTSSETPVSAPVAIKSASPVESPRVAVLPEIAPATAANAEQDSAPRSSGESSPSDTGKNQANRNLNPALDRKDLRSPSFPSSIGNEEPQKIEPAAITYAPPGTAASAGTIASTNGPSTSQQGHANDPLNANHAPAAPEPSAIPSGEVAALAAKSDVKIALHGGEFGPVELHAKMAGEVFSASITAERRETHALLSSDLPALHQALNDRQLRVSEILLLHHSLSSGGASDDGANAEREERSPQPSGDSVGSGLAKSIGEGSHLAGALPSAHASAGGIFDSRGRLSVRA